MSDLTAVERYIIDRAFDSGKFDVLDKILNTAEPRQPSATSKRKPPIGSGWTDTEIERLIRLRENGLGPAAIYRNGDLPGRSKRAISAKLGEIYDYRPDLKDNEMARRSSFQFETGDLDTKKFEERVDNGN